MSPASIPGSGGAEHGVGDQAEALELKLQKFARFGVERTRRFFATRRAIGGAQLVPGKLMRRMAGQEEAFVKRQRAASEADGKGDKGALARASRARDGFTVRRGRESLAHVSAADTKNLDVKACMKRWRREAARFGLPLNVRTKPLQKGRRVRVSGACRERGERNSVMGLRCLEAMRTRGKQSGLCSVSFGIKTVVVRERTVGSGGAGSFGVERILGRTRAMENGGGRQRRLVERLEFADIRRSELTRSLGSVAFGSSLRI